MLKLFASIDLFSFSLGLIAGILLSVLISQITHIQQLRKSNLSVQTPKRKSGSNALTIAELRDLVLKKAQAEHLLSPLCALNDILIEPKLIGVPYPLPDFPLEHLPLCLSLVPYAPDTPQLTSRLPYPTVSLFDAITKVKYLAILGDAGTGKSVALASFASRLAQQDEALGEFQHHLPLYFHAIDLSHNAEIDSIELLLGTIAHTYPSIDEKKIRDVALQSIQQKRAILMLDGMDELPPNAYAQTSEWLLSLQKSLPELPIVITLSPSNITFLPNSVFHLMGQASWRESDYFVWLKKWNTIWTHCRMQTSQLTTTSQFVETEFLEKWLKQPEFQSPLEWSLLVWGWFSGDLSGKTLPELLLAYINRITSHTFSLENWSHVSASVLSEKGITLSKNQITSTFFQGEKTNSLPKQLTANQVAGQTQPDNPKNNTEYLHLLVVNGLLRKTGAGSLRFSHSLLLSFLPSFGISDDRVTGKPNYPCWETETFAHGLAAIRTQNQDWLNSRLKYPETYYYISRTTSYLLNLPIVPQFWKNTAFTNWQSKIINENSPFSFRARLLPAIWFGNRKMASDFFQQLLTSPSPTVRRLALLGLIPYSDSNQIVQEIRNLLNDSDLQVRQTAILVLSTSPTQNSLETLMDIMVSAAEPERFAAAEALANRPSDGFDVLKEAMQVDDLLIRRAAIFGIAQINTGWSKELLDATSVQDSQWVVKNAAVQSLEILNRPNRFIPVNPVPPSEAAWLLELASSEGRGIPAGSFPTELLVQASHSTNIPYSINALQYLAENDEESIIQTIRDCTLNENPYIGDYASWLLMQNILDGKTISDIDSYNAGFMD